MKLEPSAKPIRIRIKIGNQEFSNLTTVMENFSLAELYPLYKDGRLARWLDQIGEEKLSRLVDGKSKEYPEKSLVDYLQFLSLFYADVESALKYVDVKSESDISRFLVSAPNNVLSIVFSQIKDLSQGEWRECFVSKLTSDNIYEIYENPHLHFLVDNWAGAFADIVTSEDDCRKAFRCIASRSDYADFSKVIETFILLTDKKGYSWEDMLASEQISSLAHWYKDPKINNLKLNWGKIFARLVKDWDKDGVAIEKLLADNSSHLSSFYEKCDELGYAEVKTKIDPWFQLAHSKDRQTVLSALEEWDGYKRYYSIDKYDHIEYETAIARELIQFLKFLIELRGNPHYSKDNLQGQLFSDEAAIMIAVRKRDNNNYSFLRSDEIMVNDYSKNGNQLAEFAKSNHLNNYLDVARHLVKNIIRGKVAGTNEPNRASVCPSKPIQASLHSGNPECQAFLENPQKYKPQTKSFQTNFLRSLSEIYRLDPGERQKKRVNEILYFIGNSYPCERVYLVAMAAYFDEPNYVQLAQALEPIRKKYVPAEYMWQYAKHKVVKSDLLSKHIEDYQSLRDHVMLVVSLLDC